MANYCQIGSVSMRGPDGRLLPSIPLFAEEEKLDKGTADNISKALTALLAEQLRIQKAKEASA